MMTSTYVPYVNNREGARVFILFLFVSICGFSLGRESGQQGRNDQPERQVLLSWNLRGIIGCIGCKRELE
jgi:hypothetical protein